MNETCINICIVLVVVAIAIVLYLIIATGEKLRAPAATPPLPPPTEDMIGDSLLTNIIKECEEIDKRYTDYVAAKTVDDFDAKVMGE